MKIKIKKYREKLLMIQNELAKSVGVRRETIVHLENGLMYHKGIQDK
ncbi:TPA: helix-turn-helix domain-containing protein [Clostridioides difficile]|nr:helix-turn-helix domain-containing protein [Clostridioides difficile]OFU02760.1 transcriptional regulator [Clostridium sp. HMSC19E03]OFU15292.1 transcriptional regulator [Clostridium sp. HMSC19C08]OFU18322.1 transcriptional regulator [Clostridium sp. HMSC19C09]OFU19022.1 transcriptional regulator [Clostridium sp. HMSC19C05]OFU34158.1 transcriptional regulator [Clostridium sp. HMSC19B10]OFU40577.1 transcriptional regulator [Clostridium sp. HMSC19B01]